MSHKSNPAGVFLNLSGRRPADDRTDIVAF